MFISEAIAATTEAAHETTHGASGVFPPFDSSTFASQLLWLALTFGIFYLLIAKVIIPRISGILDVRRDRISRDLDEAQRLKEESDAAIAAYEQELAEAKSKAHGIGQEAREKAKAEADAKRAASEEELAAKLSGAEKQISELKSKAMGEVDNIATDTISVIMKELIGGTVTKADISKAISAVTR